MGLLDSLEQRFLQPILDKIKSALGPFGKLFDLIGKLFKGVTNAFSTGKELAAEIISEISAWRNFREAVPVRTGVISLPIAIEKSQELLDQIRAAWDAIVDLAKQIRTQVESGTGGDPAAEAEAAVKDIEESSITNFLSKFPKLAKGLEKLLGFVAIVVGALESIVAAISDLKAIVDAIKGIREEVETGSTIFLSQKNPRRTETLSDGTKIKIRVGNLHQ